MGVKTAHFQNGPVSKWHGSKTAPEPKRLNQKLSTFMELFENNLIFLPPF